ncbi:hypothetical protein [Xanthomonas arboricola]|nr:hypothetical protein [Xanthomonas arboricola]
MTVSSLVFGMPMASIVGAALLGIANGIFPIGFIVLMAVHALVRIDSRVA